MYHNGLPSLLTELIGDLSDRAVIWQIAALALCLALAAWQARRSIASWQARRKTPSADKPWTQVQTDAVSRLLFPVLSLLALLIAQPVLAKWQNTNLLRFAIAMMIALALVRMIVYAISRLARSPALAAFERLLVFIVWISVALYISGYWLEVVAMLEASTFTIGKQSVSLWMLVNGVFWVVLISFGSIWFGGLIENRLLASESIDASLGAMIGRLIRALVLVLGLLLGLSIVGLDLTALSVFGGALGVGIGLGLQRIASNYISGFIILLERMVRIGDVVKVDQFSGQVREIRTRFTVLRTGEGIDQIVPNELLTSQTVQNFSSAGALVVKLPFIIAPDCDAAKASTIAIAAALAGPRVLPEPAPLVLFRGLNPDGLVLELFFTITEPNLGQDNVRSAVSLDLWQRLDQAGMFVPFPPRQVPINGPATEQIATLVPPGLRFSGLNPPKNDVAR